MPVAEFRRRKSDEGFSLFKASVLLFSLLLGMLVLALSTDHMLRTDHFPVRNVLFEGEFKHVSQAELQAVVLPVVRGNFFLLNLEEVKTRVESVPWVYRASVRRQWLQDIHVQFTEQQLVARWDNNAYLNQAGDVVRVTLKDASPSMPQLSGPEGSGSRVLEHYKKLGQILAVVGLKLEHLQLTERRVWRLTVSRNLAGNPQLGDKMEIVLNRDDPGEKLERFARVYAQALRAQNVGIVQVDLRYANGFAVRPSATHAAGQHITPRRSEPIGTRPNGTATQG